MNFSVVAYGSKSTKASIVGGKLSRETASSPRYSIQLLRQHSQCEKHRVVFVRRCIQHKQDISNCSKLCHQFPPHSRPQKTPLCEVPHSRETAQRASSASSTTTGDRQIHVPFLCHTTPQQKLKIASGSKSSEHQYHVTRRFASSKPRPSRPAEGLTAGKVRRNGGLLIKAISQHDNERKIEARLEDAKLKEYVKKCNEARVRVGSVEDDAVARMRISHINLWRQEVRLKAKREFRMRQQTTRLGKIIEVVVQSINSLTNYLIDVYQGLLATIRKRCEKREKKWFTLFQRKLIAPILQKLEDIANVNRNVANKVDKISKLMELRREAMALDTVKAQEMMKRLTLLKVKDKEADNWELRKKIAIASEFISDTVKYAQDLRLEYQERSKGCEIPSWLVKLNEICQSLSTCRPNILEIGHQFRKIQHNKELAKGHKDATFAQRWATSMIAYYIWPMKVLNEEFEVLLSPALEAFPSSRLEYLSTKYIKQTGSVIKAYTSMIGDGNVLMCPHPNKYLQIHQVLLMQPINYYDLLWKETRSLCNPIVYQMLQTDVEDADYISPHGARKRARIRRSIELLGKASSLDASDSLSRRGFFNIRSDLIIWHSLCVNHTDRKPLATKAFKRFNQNLFLRRIQTSDSSHAVNWRKVTTVTRWFETQDLYPIGNSVIIDFVTSHNTLERAVEEILRQEVIGIDITHTYSTNGVSEISFVTIASDNHVYILDALTLHECSPQGFKELLGSVLELPAILKVGIDHERLSEALFRDLSIDLQCFYDIAKVQGLSKGITNLETLLRKHFGVSDAIAEGLSKTSRKVFLHDPQKFFYYQALRAYGSLRLFHVLNQHDDVLTVDESVFNITTARKVAEKQQLRRLELGPVQIDRGSNNRHDLMSDLSRAIAQQYLSKTAHNLGKSPKEHIQGQVDKDIALQAVAALVLATTFREPLRNIQRYLNLPDAAKWIIWASQNEPSLRLYPVHRHWYERAVTAIEKDRPIQDFKQRPSGQNDYENLVKRVNISNPPKKKVRHPLQ